MQFISTGHANSAITSANFYLSITLELFVTLLGFYLIGMPQLVGATLEELYWQEEQRGNIKGSMYVTAARVGDTQGW